MQNHLSEKKKGEMTSTPSHSSYSSVNDLACSGFRYAFKFSHGFQPGYLCELHECSNLHERTLSNYMMRITLQDENY
jgi:hypothetical protein